MSHDCCPTILTVIIRFVRKITAMVVIDATMVVPRWLSQNGGLYRRHDGIARRPSNDDDDEDDDRGSRVVEVEAYSCYTIR
jgi:hypothetical protein